ncbi:hypothetical protein UC8_01960 [Roseimaritima ulvae]|uniref:Uncharacterized protein n=1 Tax=Roseimaritima ulvae TaxID=980254 RepID=A0A5B9QW40_9BACT|nr:hypothetical protein UC8_01960 [Roseimaritima ulvae]
MENAFSIRTWDADASPNVLRDSEFRSYARQSVGTDTIHRERDGSYDAQSTGCLLDNAGKRLEISLDLRILTRPIGLLF